MEFDRRRFVSAALALGAAAAAGPVAAQSAGREFAVLNQAQPTDEPGKVEVLEFFSYGCPHCADFNPLLAAWVARQAGDVVVKKVPVTFGRAAWANIAKLYYALEITGDQVRLEADIFRAIHQERVSLFDDKVMLEWVVKKGVDQKKFSDAYASFGVMSKVKRAEQMTQSYKISGVPTLVVEGKYQVGGREFGEALSIAEKLVVKARAEKSGKK